ncbi:MAG: ECF transporter S component, partial [Chloroflexi bacterium]|nr:ECF transporter S component [Chloroflexota bacterium]
MSDSKRKEDHLAEVEASRAAGQRLARAQKPAQERYIRRVVVAGLLLAITLLLTFTNIGFVPVPTPAGSATIAHIPTIIGGILEGPLVGLILALGFGVGSFFSPLVPVKDPLVIILPRLAIGVVAFYVYAALRRANKRTLTAMLAVLLGLLLYSSYVVSQRTLWLGIVIAV